MESMNLYYLMDMDNFHPMDLIGTECDADDTPSEEENDIEIREEDSDTEQDISSYESDSENYKNLNFYLAKDDITKWSKSELNVMKTKKSVKTQVPGPIGTAKYAKSILDCWSVFFDSDILECIVENTNKQIREIKKTTPQIQSLTVTNLIEIKAFLGILYMIGVTKYNKLNTKDIWSTDGTGIEIIRPCMSENRFKFLLRNITFDDKSTRNDRLKIDKLAPIRNLFDKFVKNCQNNYNISEYATIDEKLEEFRGNCRFKQYIPSKPNKYGIKIFALVDSMIYYTSNLEVYVGAQPRGPYYVENSPRHVVERLCEPIKGSGRNITVDNWFTSYDLAMNLLKSYNLTLVGTIRKNRRELPTCFINIKNRRVYSSLFGFQKRCTLLSYTPRKRKNVLLISTLHHNSKIDANTGEKQKPEIITFYNMTKSGVDRVDEMSASYNCARFSRRWPVVIFYSLMNVAGINSQIIHFANGNESGVKSRREYLKNLAFDLMNEYLKVKFETHCIHKPLINSEKKSFRSPEEKLREQIQQTLPDKRGRCYECGRKKNRQTRYLCYTCCKYICLQHALTVCPPCSQTCL